MRQELWKITWSLVVEPNIGLTRNDNSLEKVKGVVALNTAISEEKHLTW